MLIGVLNNANALNKSNSKSITKDSKATNSCNTLVSNIPVTYPANYYLSFQGTRVNKGLRSFYQRNTDVMPSTVKKYIESTEDRQLDKTTPLEAQYKAFEYLEITETPDDIKQIYPDEPLFQTLKNVQDSKATKGLLYDIKLMEDDIKEEGSSILSTGENLTVYLVKKIFLEGKTLNQINDDLDNDLNPIFKKDDKNYILPSTLKGLGIQLPKTEYINSLKYTRDGYADAIGEKLRLRWKNMSEQEKAAFRDNAIKKQENIAPDVKEAAKLNRAEAQRQRWANLSPEEKTRQIQALSNGSRKQRIIMIDAWNKTPEVREALSRTLTGFHISNPIEKLYKKNYSTAMKEAMTNFWEKNENYSSQLGNAIASSAEEFKKAKEIGTEEEFAQEVLNEQSEILKKIKEQKDEELATYNIMGFAAFANEIPYCPYDAAMTYGTLGAKILYSSADNSNFSKFFRENPDFAANINFSRIKGLAYCIDDENKRYNFVKQFIDADIKTINYICKNLRGGIFEFEVESKKGTTKLKFDRKPNSENIDSYFTKYQKPLSDEDIKTISKAVCEIAIQGKLPPHINTSSLLKNIRKTIKSMGGIACEAIEEDSPIQKTILYKILNESLIEEICDIHERYKQKGKGEEFKKYITDYI